MMNFWTFGTSFLLKFYRNHFSVFLLLVLWRTSFLDFEGLFSNWFGKLISILSLHLWISIYVFVSLFFTIYKYESTHFLMLFKTRTTNLQKENPYFKRIENNLTFSDHTMEWNCEQSHFHSLVSMIILFWNFMFGFVIILIVF
jgi:hypothetical protein